jgi:AAA15 family ATPase/GTPase
MLLGLRVENVLSFRDEQRLSFVATEFNDGSARPTGLRDRGRDISVIPVIGLFGANASGKTNVLAALRLMRSAVLDSLQWFTDPTRRRRIAFALDPALSGEPSFYEIDLAIDGVRYTYAFEIDDERVRGEWLHVYPKGRKQIWFDREDDRIDFPGEGLRGEKLELARMTRPDALFLTTAAQFNQKQLLPIVKWFRDNLWLVGPDEGDWSNRLAYTRDRVIEDDKFRRRVVQLLRVADLGITDIEIVSKPDKWIRFVHRTGSGTAALDLADESLGTKSWFALLGPLLLVLDQGSVLLVDELDASLHPEMTAEIVAMFDSPSSNPSFAQLLFTTQDVALLRTLTGGGRLLDRDAVWLAKKGPDGVTQLYPITDADPAPRKDANLERGYLLGRYGARPRVARGEIVDTLALARAA